MLLAEPNPYDADSEADDLWSDFGEQGLLVDII